MSAKYYRNFNEYLNSCNIAVVGNLEDKVNIKAPLSQVQVHDHLAAISEFHKKVMGFTGFISGRLDNCTGKKVEQYKIYIKKLKRDIKRLETSEALSKFEEVLLSKATENLQRAEGCVKEIYNKGYYELIERSMKRNEVCLGNTFTDNIIKEDDIKVRSIRKCCFNMVECDAVYFLGKMKKRGLSINWMEAIKVFCELEALDENSEKFILASMSYPVEFMKTCDRYRYDKKEWNEDEYMERLLRAVEKDGQSLL